MGREIASDQTSRLALDPEILETYQALDVASVNSQTDGWTRVIGAIEPLEIFDWIETRWVPSVNPAISVGFHPGAD